MKKKKRNDFVIGYYRQKIIWSGLNDFYAESASSVLFFLNEDNSVKQVRETMQYRLFNPHP